MPKPDLYPTPTRIALLRDVDAGLVAAGAEGNVWRDERLAAFYDPMTATCTKVTARARELRDAGWIEVGLYRSYRLTEQGRDVVAGVTHPSDQAGGA